MDENNISRFKRYCKKPEYGKGYMIALRDDDGTLIGYYEKHAYKNRETQKMYYFK